MAQLTVKVSADFMAFLMTEGVVLSSRRVARGIPKDAKLVGVDYRRSGGKDITSVVLIYDSPSETVDRDVNVLYTMPYTGE